MVSLSSFTSKVAIEPETEPVYVLADGSVRNATDSDEDDGNLIVAEKDMLPVARDSELRTWGFYSMAGCESAPILKMDMLLVAKFCRQLLTATKLNLS